MTDSFNANVPVDDNSLELLKTATQGSGGRFDSPSLIQPILRTIVLGSAAFMMPGATGYAATLSQYGTSPLIRDVRSQVTQLADANVISTSTAISSAVHLRAADQIRDLLAALSLNKSQMAAVLGVTRPTLYDWLGGSEPSALNANRIDFLCKVIEMAGVSRGSPLNTRFVRRPIAEGQPSLLDALADSSTAEDKLLSLLKMAQSAGKEAAVRRESRQARLRDLGYDEPSSEQRKQNTAVNAALRPWPKQ